LAVKKHGGCRGTTGTGWGTKLPGGGCFESSYLNRRGGGFWTSKKKAGPAPMSEGGAKNALSEGAGEGQKGTGARI